MRAEYLWAVQCGIYDHLSADTAVTGLLAAGAEGLYDQPPLDAAYPYCVFGNGESRPIDTMGTHGARIIVSIETYSRTGSHEAKTIADALYTAMHGARPVCEGLHVVDCRFVSSRTTRGDDNKTHRIEQVFEIIVEAQES